MFVLANEFYDFDGFPMATDNRYGKRHVMNAKLYANIYLTPNLYLTAGVTRLILLDKPWPFFGAGVYFTDWDIQGLFTGSKNKNALPTATWSTTPIPMVTPPPDSDPDPTQNINTSKPSKSVTPKSNKKPTTNPNETPDAIPTLNTDPNETLSPMPQPDPYPPAPDPTPPPP